MVILGRKYQPPSQQLLFLETKNMVILLMKSPSAEHFSVSPIYSLQSAYVIHRQSSGCLGIWQDFVQYWQILKCEWRSSYVLGNSRKYPYPTTDGFHVLKPPSPSEFLFFFGSTFSTQQRLYEQTDMNLCLLNVVIQQCQATSFTLQRQEKPTASGQVVQTPFLSLNLTI